MNSFEEVMMEVYRLDHAEFDAPPKHRFSRRHDKAMKEVLYPDYFMTAAYRIEQDRVPPKKRILVAALVIVLAIIGTAAGAVALSGLIRKTDSGTDIADCVTMLGTTWFEDGMFYETQNKDGESVLCYYSKKNDRSAVMCGMPECTHASKTSPGCGALAGSDTHSRCGFNRIGDKLYFIEEKLSDENSIGSVDLIECDIDGKNRRVAASIKDTFIPFVTDIKYFEGHVLVTYYQNFDLVKNEGTGEFEFVNLEKYKFYMQWIDLSTGEIETLVFREEYDGYGVGTVYENVLYYSFACHDVPPTGEFLTAETAPPWLREFHILDLSTGEDKVYEDIWPFADSYTYFSPERIMACDLKNKNIYLFNSETGEKKVISDYNNGGYTSDGKDALFDEGQDSGYWTKFNFETGELTHYIPNNTGSMKIYLNSAFEVGGTVWLEVDSGRDNSLGHAYIDREDFYNGNFENIRLIKEVELK